MEPSCISARIAVVLAPLVALLSTSAAVHAAPAVTLTVHADKAGAAISPTMWGVFFEDINYGADGGLYPELVKNGSFEFPEPLMGWHVRGANGTARAVTVRHDGPPGSNNRHYLRVVINGGGTIDLANEGFFGMGIERGAEYSLSLLARGARKDLPEVGFKLVSDDGLVLATGALEITAAPESAANQWKRLGTVVKANYGDPKAALHLIFNGKGTIDIDLVSLYPKKTFRNHGLRTDMAQMLADLKPGFMRFPGGCIVEGHTLANRYQWKTTIGPRGERKLIMNRWNDEFKHRPSPDYYQSFGLGFFEYFQLCEDIGAEPLPILNCGMACQFNSGELCPMDRLDPFIQDALDLIEFANGPATSTWGAKRAAMGHPRPFNMKMLGVGNEQWLQQYIDRYTAFAKVLKAKHPEIKLIAAAGPGPDDDKFHFAWPRLRALHADIVDEHCYARPDWFLDNSSRYDGYDRNGPKVFMGEYAAQSDKVVSVNNRNNWECALAEAAYMTGLERNAGVVVMASYAPLFGNEEGWQWRPNLIWCDSLRSYGTPGYYVQQLFSRNRGDLVLPADLTGALPAEKGKPRFYATAALDEKSRDTILKVVNATNSAVETAVKLDGAKVTGVQASVTVLTAAPADENSFSDPRKVAPATTSERLSTPQFEYNFKPYSMTVFRLPVGQ
jgi:alpha-L-arabinofuranosidase